GITVNLYDPDPNAPRKIDEIMVNAKLAFGKLIDGPVPPQGKLHFTDSIASAVARADLIIEAVGRDDWFELPKAEKLSKTKEMGIDVDPELEDFEVTNDVFEKVIEHTLVQPTFVTHIPKELCPLAKITQSDPSTIDVFELCINGQEIAPAYSEQNDPAVQREAFLKQVGEETQELDDDFLLALEHGMPPAGGMGMGIDRLVIFLTKAANIRDTILFPTLRPL
ncbi:MAG: hypothetical protein EBY48_05045, partial [Opitutae bacterium]|nr:hypothetical protein [Opitutae bacterium]